jgi:hypothetical protein
LGWDEGVCGGGKFSATYTEALFHRREIMCLLGNPQYFNDEYECGGLLVSAECLKTGHIENG